MLTSGLSARQPIQLLTGDIDFVDNLRCYGCEVWRFVSERTEPDLKSRKGVRLRSLPHRNYKVWDIETCKVIHVRHGKINESIFPAKEWKHNENDEGILDSWISNMGTYEYNMVATGIQNPTDGNSPTAFAAQNSESQPQPCSEENITYYPSNVFDNTQDDTKVIRS